MTTPLCIYVAGPLGATTGLGKLSNIYTAMAAGLELIKRGHHPLVPHLSVHLDELATLRKEPVPYERWMALDFAWLSRADAILYLAPSPGADRELAFAREERKIVFQSLDEVPDLSAHGFDGVSLRSEILYYGRRTVVACDRDCTHAWGCTLRPRSETLSEDEDDFALLSDVEAGTAPEDPGTYEGGYGKPMQSLRHNKWCVRECERSVKWPWGQPEKPLPDFSGRTYNIPSRHQQEVAAL